MHIVSLITRVQELLVKLCYIVYRMSGIPTLYYFEGRGRAEIIRLTLCAVGKKVNTKLQVLIVHGISLVFRET